MATRDTAKNRKTQKEIKQRAQKSMNIMIKDCQRRGYKTLARLLKQRTLKMNFA